MFFLFELLTTEFSPTTLFFFSFLQWVRYLEDGSVKYIEGIS